VYKLMFLSDRCYGSLTMKELHPQTRAVLEAMAAMNLTPPDKLPVQQAREQFKRARAPFVAPAQAVASVVDRAIPGPAEEMPVRLYRPQGSRPSEMLPALVYFHGGGWVFGDLDTHDPLCREVSNLAGCAVVSVAYRVAPENKFPAAVDDAVAAIRYIADNGHALGIDGTRIAAAGDSAGGTLSTAAALTFRDQGGPRMCLQALIYPVTDMTLDSAGYNRVPTGYTLPRERMLYFREAYLRGPEDIADWRASPLKARDVSNLPPALILTAAQDPLVEEAKAYADRLAAAGVPVEYTCYEGMVHGFLTLAGAIDAGHTAIAQVAASLKQAFFARAER
jgi:acetyl esterase